MAESFQDEQMDQLPESRIQARSKFSIVWLVPFIAILVGGWIGYQAWSKMGPTITITFKTADGLEAGKTKIKYKNVEVGGVKSIQVNHETMNIIVTAELDKDISAFLTDQTQFWVVRARINASGVSGLSTLLSGAYIGIDPSSKGQKTRSYTGLDTPPVVTRNKPGKHFILYAQNLGSLERDAPIYYRKFSVGRVEDVKLNNDGQSVTVKIFIDSPYDQWVNRTTKFWNASGIDFSMNANGINMDTESLVSILIGGIAFETHDLGQEIEPAENNSTFTLYTNRKASLERDDKTSSKFVINFSESVRGLTVGAPVDFRGIQLGEVTDIHLSYDTVTKQVIVPVTIRINYDHIAFTGEYISDVLLDSVRQKRTNFFVKQGLRAQLQTGNLLTGQLYIALDFFPDATPYQMNWDTEVPEFPSMPGTMGAIKHNITSILKKVDAMMTQVKELSYKLNHNIEPELSVTLKQTTKSLASIENTLKNESPLQQDLQTALREFAKAARSVKNLTDYLERHPESLIEGKKGN